MDADIALADLASGMAVPIRAECGCGVHAGPPGFVWKHTKRSMAGPLFSLQVSFTTVKWGAIARAVLGIKVPVDGRPVVYARSQGLCHPGYTLPTAQSGQHTSASRHDGVDRAARWPTP